MYGLKSMLLEEKNRLQEIAEKTRNQLKDAPTGSLRVSKSNNRIQYYHCTEDNHLKNGKYLHQAEEELVRQLAQKGYDEKVLRLVEKRLRQLRCIAEAYQDDEIENLYLREHEARRKIICPVEPTWNQRLEQWMSEKYEGKGFGDGNPMIYSEKGERMRSKSEKILADYFYRKNIPYKYERPLSLKGYGIVYPDFTFLSRRTGKEIYWEHEGRMDDPEYARSAIKKIQTYEENGIYAGDRLILTYETETTILNTKDIARKVNRYLI